MLALLVILWATFSRGHHEKNDTISLFQPDTRVAISGKLVKRKYYDANGNEERPYILVLDRVIGVGKDEIGDEAANITEVQLVFLSPIKYPKTRKLTGRTAWAYGRLEHQISAHHHTAIFLVMDSLRLR